MKNYFRMLQFARPALPYFIGGVICMAFSTLFEGVQLGAIVPIADKIFNNQPVILPEGTPDVLVQLADYINNQEQYFLFHATLIILPILFLFKGLFFYFQGILMNMVSQKSVMIVKNRLFSKYQELSLDFYSKKRQGELMSRITNDVGTIAHALSYGLTDTFYQSFQIIMYSAIALTLNAKLVGIVVILFPIIGFIIYRVGKMLKKISSDTQESMADLNSIIAEANQGISIIKGFGREQHEIERFESANKSYYKNMIKGIRRTLMMSPVTELISVCSIIFVLYYGGKEVIEGKVSFGVFVLFLGSLLSVIRPIKKLSAVYGINQQALAASKRIYDILDLNPTVVEEENPQPLVAPERAIRLEQVSFKYEKTSDAWVLEDISHDFLIGKTTALVGPTGCGKTTLLNLMPRFYDPDKGAVYFDDQPIKQASLKSLRQHIGLVTQDMILFNDTIRANLQFGKADAKDHEILDACQKALASEFIERMPEGLDTRIGDRGVRLSGGQKQRLCIARAILKNPKILLLDEATSALDAESEHYVQQALDNLMQERTVIVVAHRLSTIKNADCILVIDQGRLVQTGKHHQLLESSDLYAKLASYHFNQS